MLDLFGVCYEWGIVEIGVLVIIGIDDLFCVMFCVDMDVFLIKEVVDIEFVSNNEG